MVYLMPVRTRVRVREDWDDAGDFSNPYADVSAAKHLQQNVRAERGRDQGRVIGGPKVATASWSLTNESRRYASEYSGSPLSGLLVPGHKIDIARDIGDEFATWDDDRIGWDSLDALWAGTDTVTIFTGHAEKPVERYGIGQRTVAFSAFSAMQRLIDTKITVDYQASITTGAAMVLALTAAGLSSDQYLVDSDEIANGYTMLNYYVDGRSAMDACRQIWATAGPPSAFYDDGQGVIHFEGRHYRTLNSRCTSVQQKFYDQADTDYYHTDIQLDASTDSIINTMSVDVELRTTLALQKVFDYGSPLTIGPSAVVEVFVSNTSSDPWTNIQTPDVFNDFAVGAGSLTSVVLVPLGPLTALVIFTAGGGGARIDPFPASGNAGFQLRAQPVVVVSTTTAKGTIDTSASIAAYGKRTPKTELAGIIWKNLSITDANSLIDGYLVAYPVPRQVITVTLTAGNGHLLIEMLTRQISDRIYVFDAWSGISLDVSIEQIIHEIDNQTVHRCILTCERVVELDWGLWDVALWDVGKWGQ
jgi:hypothetical protein